MRAHAMHKMVSALSSALVAGAACQTADTPRVSEPPAAAGAQAEQKVSASGSMASPAAPPAAAPAAAVEVAAPADVAAIPRDAKRTASGLGYRLLQKGGGGRHPQASSQVLVHYSGWTTDGKRFDSSVVRGSPAKFGVGQLIPGWTEGLQLMAEGDKMRLWVPSKLAYNDAPGMPAGMLVFDVELIQIF